MCALNRLGLALFPAIALCSTAIAAPSYHPGFACPRPDNSDALAVALCSDPSMAKAELDLEKVFYAHRAQDGKGAYQALKLQAVAYDKALRDTCSIPAAGTPGAAMPASGQECYIKTTEQQTSEWAKSLTGPFAQEAARDIDLHIALQQKLINANFGDGMGRTADGIYGDATRAAIKMWQSAEGYDQTGAISDAEVPGVQKLGVSRAVRWANSKPEPSLSGDRSVSPVLRIFQSDMLGIQRPYLEQITGPAKYVNKRPDKVTTYTYSLASCDLTAFEENGEILGYGLQVTPACTVPLTPFIQNSTPTVANMTIGDVNAALNGSGSPVADCLEGCGNAADPNLGLFSQGSHAEDYVNVEVYTPVADDKSVKAYSDWGDAMKKGENDGYIVSGKFNCDGKYSDAGIRAIGRLPVSYLFVGKIPSDISLSINGQCNQ